MKLIIAGSRDHTVPHHRITEFMNRYCIIWPDEVVSGRASGVDLSGETWAGVNNVPVMPFPYQRDKGRAGGPLRNQEMAEYADYCIAYPGPDSSGTWNMIANMELRDKAVWVIDAVTLEEIPRSQWKKPRTPPAWNPDELVSSDAVQKKEQG